MTSERADSPGVRLPPPLLYVAGFLAGVVLELAWPTDWPPGPAAAVVAVIAGVAWLALDGAAMTLFRRAGTGLAPGAPSTALVTSGPYRLSRNPMYAGMACLYVGVAFALRMMWPLAVLPAVLVLVDRLVIAREEPYLERRFSREYRDYRARVRRWI